MAVFLNDSAPIRFAGCVFTDNRSGVHGGGVLVQASAAQIDSCVFVRNIAPVKGGAVGIFSPYLNGLEQCTIVGNRASVGGGGVFVYQDGQTTVRLTIVANNTGNGLEREGGASFSNSCNDVWGNTPADYQNLLPGADSFSLDPLFCDPDTDDYGLQSVSPCAPPNSPACGLIGALPANCGGLLIRVPDDYGSILYAINAAETGDTVAVAQGQYFEHLTLKNYVQVLGGWRSDFTARDPLAYPSVIDAGGSLSAVVAQNGETPAAVLDGFVITGGNRPDDVGGGVYCFGASPTISNNVFHDNQGGQGAAIGCLAGAEPVIIGNLFFGNVATESPGGAIYIEGSARVEGNTFDANTGPLASGIVIRAGARPVVTRNIIVNGVSGVGIYADQGAVPTSSCNDVWNNSGGDYFGALPGPDSFSLDPLFCRGPDRLLHSDSPCAPPQAPGACGLMGARDVGCTTVLAVTPPAVPGARNWLGPSFPNPMRQSAMLTFALARESEMELLLFDASGRLVRTLASGMWPPGEHRVFWNGVANQGAPLAAGMYFYELTAGHERIGRNKLVILR